MTTSELSDALNPYARHRQNVHEYSPQTQHILYQPVVQPVQQHVPHVSELEMAITGPVPAQQPVRPRQDVQILAEIMGMITATRQAQQEESQRRLAWEQEQDARYAQRQADAEHRLSDMFDEIKALRSTINALNNNNSSSTALSPPNAPSPPTPQLPTTPASTQPASPSLSAFQPAFFHPQPQQIPVRESPSNPLPVASLSNDHRDRSNSVQTQPYQEHTFQVSLVPSTQELLTPGTSPQVVESPKHAPMAPRPRKRRKKKRKPSPSSDDDESSSSSSSSVAHKPRKRRNNHDTQCYTIQHAMRLHVLHMMGLDTDKALPDSHPESTSLSPSDPIRFVWDKTPKQSVHNGRMKKRVIEDIKENRMLYKHVGNKEFNKKQLDAAFEQCFVTLRQKFKNQRDEDFAHNYKQREDAKARKARHLSRRKIKLTNRSETRNSTTIFEHVAFDGALQEDCMSSEESDNELDPESPQSISILRTRGYAWRSKRLLRFYEILDDEERTDTNTKLKRGLGKRERRVGPLKEGFILPPQGSATWMISKRWYKSSLTTRPDLSTLLSKRISDTPDFDWPNFHELGDESPDEQDVPARASPSAQTGQLHSFQIHLQNSGLSIPTRHYTTGTFMNYTL